MGVLRQPFLPSGSGGSSDSARPLSVPPVTRARGAHSMFPSCHRFPEPCSWFSLAGASLETLSSGAWDSL